MPAPVRVPPAQAASWVQRSCQVHTRPGTDPEGGGGCSTRTPAAGPPHESRQMCRGQSEEAGLQLQPSLLQAQEAIRQILCGCA